MILKRNDVFVFMRETIMHNSHASGKSPAINLRLLCHGILEKVCYFKLIRDAQRSFAFISDTGAAGRAIPARGLNRVTVSLYIGQDFV